MNDQLVFCKEEGIRFNFPWCLDDFLFFFGRKLRKLIHKVPVICGAWDDETEVESVFPDYFSAEEVFLNHSHIFNLLWSNAMLNVKSKPTFLSLKN